MAEVLIWAPGALKQPGDLVRPTNSGVVSQTPLENGNFDAGDSGWTDTGLGSWTIDTDAPVFDGTYSGKAGFTDNPNGQQLVVTNDEVLTCVPGQIIVARAFLFGPTAVGQPSRCQFRIQWYNSSMAALAPTNLPLDPTDLAGEARVNASGLVQYACREIWLPIEVEGVAPAAAAFFEIVFIFSWGDMPFAVDGVSVDYANVEDANTLLFRAVQAAAGFTGNNEPVWPTSIGLTVVDNEVTWEAVSGTSVTWEASRILVSQCAVSSEDVEPDWPLLVNGSVPDGSIIWSLNSRRVTDEHIPTDSEVVLLAASKVYAADQDIISYSATVNPLDWSTRDDAGFIPFGLQVYGANPITAMGLYRGNIAAFNSQGCQIWQVDADPAAITFLDALPIPCTYPKSLAPVGDDLALLTNLGIRSLGVAGAQVNLSGGYFGKQVDPLVVAAIAEALAEGWTPRGLYWPAHGQYMLFFGAQAFVLTINGPAKEQRSWSRYTFPSVVDAWTILGTDLYLRSGDLVWRFDPDVYIDDSHDVESLFLGLTTAEPYDTAGWVSGTDTIALGASQDFENGTAVQIFGQPHPNVAPSIVAVGNTVVAYSTDPTESWTMGTPAAAQNWTDVAYSPTLDRWVKCSTDGAVFRSAYSDDGGATWTASATPLTPTKQWVAVCWSTLGNQYVALASSGGPTTQRIATSPDGDVWTVITHVAQDDLRDILEAPELSYTLFALANNALLRSLDGGDTWEAVAGYAFTGMGNLAWSGTRLYAAGGGDIVMYFAVDGEAPWLNSGVQNNGHGSVAVSPDNVLIASPSTLAAMVYNASATANGFALTFEIIDGRFWTDSLWSTGFEMFFAASDATDAGVPFAYSETGLAGSWGFPEPAGFGSAVWNRLREGGSILSYSTELFSTQTVTGAEGATSVTASTAVLAEEGDALIVQYSAEGPFEVVAGNTVGSTQIELDAPIENYLAAGTVLRITRDGGTDYNYLEVAIDPGETRLRLLAPLANAVESLDVFPAYTTIINSVDDSIGYAIFTIAADSTGTTLTLDYGLSAVAAALPMIVRPYQRTTVAGGQGTADVEVTDDTVFSNNADFTPAAGFPAAPVVIGDMLDVPEGELYTGVVQWPFLDMGNLAQDKELIGFDLSIDGECTVSIGYDQRFTEYFAGGPWTAPYAIDGDTMPGSETLPFSVSASSFAMRLEFSGDQAWTWFSSSITIKDLTQ